MYDFVPPGTRVRYGALELKQSYQASMVWATTFAILLHLAVLTAFLAWGRPGYPGRDGGAFPVPRHIPLTMSPIHESLPRGEEATPLARPFPKQPPVVLDPTGRIFVPVPDEPAHTLSHAEVDLSETPGADVTGGPTDGDPPGTSMLVPGDGPAGLPSPDTFIWMSSEPRILPGMTMPEYPPLARETGVEAMVRLRILISEKGEVLDVRVLPSRESPNETLIDAATKAAWKWKFVPAFQNDRSVTVWYDIPVVFKLR